MNNDKIPYFHAFCDFDDSIDLCGTFSKIGIVYGKTPKVAAQKAYSNVQKKYNNRNINCTIAIYSSTKCDDEWFGYDATHKILPIEQQTIITLNGKDIKISGVNEIRKKVLTKETIENMLIHLI